LTPRAGKPFGSPPPHAKRLSRSAPTPRDCANSPITSLQESTKLPGWRCTRLC
jgi:hypothetical protein